MILALAIQEIGITRYKNALLIHSFRKHSSVNRALHFQGFHGDDIKVLLFYALKSLRLTFSSKKKKTGFRSITARTMCFLWPFGHIERKHGCRPS
jgi:hypothetical protein